MELKERMYVRIKNKVGYCVIGKIENINDYRDPMMKYCIDIQGNDFIFVPEEMIIKASNNIIDLIEDGDYVNGNLIEMFYDCWNDEIEDYEDILGIAIYDDARMDCIEEIRPLRTLDIKSIVTKEQFKSMSYKVN